MPKDQGPSSDTSADEAVTTADGTDGVDSPEAPASETQPTTTTKPTRAVDVEEYERELAEAMSPAPVAAEPEQGTPAEEQTPPDPEQTPTESQSEEPEDLDPANEAGPTKQKEFRPRLGGIKDDRQKEAILLVSQLGSAGESISLTEAENRIAAKYGDSPKPAEVADPDAPAPRTLDMVQAEIAAKEQEADEAAEQIDTSAMNRLNKELRALEREHFKLEREDETSQMSAQEHEDASFQADVDASQSRAVEIYPVVGEKDHAIHAKADEIWKSMESEGNPLIFEASAPLKVYQMAANDLGIAPRMAGASPAAANTRSNLSTPAAPKKPQSVQSTAVRRPNPSVSLPSGGDRATPTGPPASPVEKIHSAHDYDKLVESMHG